MNSIDELDFSKTYTYADYYSWRFEERLELIKGKVFKMSPAPSRGHQVICGNIFRSISNFLWEKTCEVYSAPFDVRFVRKQNGLEAVKTVVQPDICIICDLSKLMTRVVLVHPILLLRFCHREITQKSLN